MDTKKAGQAEHSEENERDIKKQQDADDAKGSKKSIQTEPASAKPTAAKSELKKNNVRKLRMERMMSKAELARRAGLSTLTVDRVEKGKPCRMDTKRKILEALGLTPSDRVTVFGEDY